MKKIFILFFLLLCPIIVNAETGYTTDKTGWSLHSSASTKASTIETIPYKEEFYIINLEAAPAGNGCGSPWYYVHYKQDGYVCSSGIKVIGVTNTSYNRPWTSPKKAIVGGGQFIASGYISKGQYTTYFKKNNVAPNSFYQPYSHQYQANLRAPASEAFSTYNTLRDTNLLNNAFNFAIPVFTNMPEKNYQYTGIYQIDTPSTTDVADSDFETMIKDFPDDYKPYLRYIHKNHSNWSFTPVITNLDFNEVFANEKGSSSIDDDDYCEKNPYTSYESGWCVGTDDVTKFFLDPRNFLNEKYVFMFENLGYNTIENETVVASNLSGSFMSGLSVLDNQSYASIFVEAGKSANVSPLYLSSLSIQEVGRNLSNLTNGAEFTYEGYTYKGAYNFFGIGASSGESNPALAGLVYASGGTGANGATKADGSTPDNPTTVTNDFVAMLGVSKVGSYIKGYGVGTTIIDIKNKAISGATITIKDASGTVKSDGSLIATGDQINIKNSAGEENYVYVLYGDLTGDGEINSADLLKLRQHLLGINNLGGAYATSANVTKDSEINSADILKIRQYLLGMSNIDQ